LAPACFNALGTVVVFVRGSHAVVRPEIARDTDLPGLNDGPEGDRCIASVVRSNANAKPFGRVAGDHRANRMTTKSESRGAKN
jgi:hypothetical protein